MVVMRVETTHVLWQMADKERSTTMTPYVDLQRAIISWMFGCLEMEPSCGGADGFLREMVRDLRNPEFKFFENWGDFLRNRGLRFPDDDGVWDVEKEAREIFLEQVDDSDPNKLAVKNLLGLPMPPREPVDLLGWITQRGSGQNTLRTPCFAQPRALQPGDTLVTGERVLSPPREGGDGVLIHISGGTHGTWLSLPSRVAVALLCPEDETPPGLIED